MTPTARSVTARAIRAVVCDDSAFMRALIANTLRQGGVDVVAQCADGADALVQCARLTPDVLTLDLQMAGLSGMEVLRLLPPDGPGVIVVSAHTDEGSALAIEALSFGAADVIGKPTAGETLASFTNDLAASVVAATAARAGRRPPAPVTARPPAAPARSLRPRAIGKPLVVVACSTGGPAALARLVPELPNPCGAGVLIVQHMPAGFTRSLAQRLDRTSRLHVREAADGDAIDPRTALLAPGGSHLRLGAGGLRLTREDPIGGLRPRADLTIEDVSCAFGPRTVLVVLTGMGSDGLIGARAVRRAGGIVMTEAEETCVVYGMPRSIAEAGLADHVRPLPALAAALAEVVR